MTKFLKSKITFFALELSNQKYSNHLRILKSIKRKHDFQLHIFNLFMKVTLEPRFSRDPHNLRFLGITFESSRKLLINGHYKKG